MKAQQSDKYYGVFELSAVTHQKITHLIEQLHHAPNPKKHRAELNEVIRRLVEEGLEFFFLHPIRLLEINFLLRKATETGVKGVSRTVLLLTKRVINTLSDKQLRTVATILTSFVEP